MSQTDRTLVSVQTPNRHFLVSGVYLVSAHETDRHHRNAYTLTIWVTVYFSVVSLSCLFLDNLLSISVWCLSKIYSNRK